MRYRTITKAYEEIKSQDKNTSLTKYSIRRYIKEEKIRYIMSGKKYLVELNSLLNYLNKGEL